MTATQIAAVYVFCALVDIVDTRLQPTRIRWTTTLLFALGWPIVWSALLLRKVLR